MKLSLLALLPVATAFTSPVSTNGLSRAQGECTEGVTLPFGRTDQRKPQSFFLCPFKSPDERSGASVPSCGACCPNLTRSLSLVSKPRHRIHTDPRIDVTLSNVNPSFNRCQKNSNPYRSGRKENLRGSLRLHYCRRRSSRLRAGGKALTRSLNSRVAPRGTQATMEQEQERF